MTGSTDPNPPQQPQQQQQQPGPSGTGTGTGTGTGARAGAVTGPPAPPSIQIPPPDPQAQHAQQQQQQPPSPVGYGAYPPAPPSPGGYPQAPPSPGGYPQAPPSPGGYPQAPPSPGYQQVAPILYGTPVPYRQPYYQQPVYYGQLPPQPYVQQPYVPQGQPLQQQPGQPPLQPYAPQGQPVQQQPGQPPQQPYAPQGQPDQQERGQLPQQPYAPQGQPLQQLPGQPPQQPYVPQGQPLQQLPGQLPQQGQYPQAPYSPQYAYPPPQAPYYPAPQGFPQQQPGYAPYGQQFPMDPNHSLTGPHQPPQSGKPKQYSPGYTFGQIAVGYDPSTDATVIKKALSKNNRVDLDALLKILPTLTPLQIESLKGRIYQHSPQELTTNATGTDDSVKLGIHGLLYGPRDFDAFMVHRAISDKVKFGTSFKYTWMLSLALLGRKDGDIEAIKDSYKRMFGDTLLPLLKEALKKETLLANLFMNALENHSYPGLSEVPEANKKALEDEINKEADDLFTATVGNVEGNKFAWVFTTSSEERLKDIMAAFQTRHKQSLASVVEKKLKKTEAFRDELLYILRGVDNRPKRDAELLESTMKGIGTKDTQLTFRLITISWDKEHLTKVKDAYKRRFPTRGSLLLRIEGDTSGEHEKFLKALVNSDTKK